MTTALRINDFGYSGPVHKWVRQLVPADELIQVPTGPRYPHLVPVGRDQQPRPSGADDDAHPADADPSRRGLTAAAGEPLAAPSASAPYSASAQPSQSAPYSAALTDEHEDGEEDEGEEEEEEEGTEATGAGGGGARGGGGGGAQPSYSAYDSMDVDLDEEGL
ncbi:hypothetical protein MNEG_13878 [Monoraphidium neglectum]|uniref:Uncharacterized protein n=1 Tax=Monoraphidium neglectum TaxID=145388 RepID=A0A0D2LQW4_9CHLO|nr:hypothetical protein MNEG_13878 [Monoraphidium neglectum]KIY94084.1 hypothetical protein MNEG_13878 [Monoraphidium neglectum]|eukprot:XP_013893104.1 hypothetical protein MNEG_13878 [Monoraphidium neglectum]